MNKLVRTVAANVGRCLRLWALLPLLWLLVSNSAWAECVGGHNVPLSCSPAPADCSYATTPGATINPAELIGVAGASGNVFWELAPGSNCSGSASSIVCLGMNIALPAGAPDTAVAQSATVTLNGKAQMTNGESQFTLTVTDESDTNKTCSRVYRPRVTDDGGGWGDPHITTVDGIHYDFQSAGEFIALRGVGLEIQTRQTGIATSTVPTFVNAYTGLSSCVALYTAVAARVGAHRVTYQPNISGVPDPSGLQLRVDGVLTTLGPDGITLDDVVTEPGLSSAGHVTGASRKPAVNRIMKTPEGNGIEIYYANGTRVLVTSAWWPDQQKWYLNVDVRDTSAGEGIMGRIAPGSWLPALADGTTVGPRPGSTHERFVQLYTTFANSWRVGAASLFDYAPGTSTADFTVATWPVENPNSCEIPQQPVAGSMPVAEAQQLCNGIANDNDKANCVFDVAATGFAGFAQTYQLTERLALGATKTTLSADKTSAKTGENVTFTATVERTVPRPGGPPTGQVQFIVDGANTGAPVMVDTTGIATQSISTLAVGTHQVMAKFVSGGFGERFLPSDSLAVDLTITQPTQPPIPPTGLPWWLIVLLILLLLAILLIWKLRR